MNNVAAIKWTLAKVKEHGAAVNLSTLEKCLPSESLTEVDLNDCREWLDTMLAQHGPDYRAMEALVLKLTTIGSAISDRLTESVLNELSVEEINRLMEAYLAFKQVIEELLPNK